MNRTSAQVALLAGIVPQLEDCEAEETGGMVWGMRSTSGGPVVLRCCYVPLDGPQGFQSRVPVIAEDVPQRLVTETAFAGQRLRPHPRSGEEGSDAGNHLGGAGFCWVGG